MVAIVKRAERYFPFAVLLNICPKHLVYIDTLSMM